MPMLEFFERAAWLDLFGKDLSSVTKTPNEQGIFEIARPLSPLPQPPDQSPDQKAPRTTPSGRERRRQCKGRPLRGKGPLPGAGLVAYSAGKKLLTIFLVGLSSFHPVPRKGRLISVMRCGAGCGGRSADRRGLCGGRFKPRSAGLAVRHTGGGTSAGDDGADLQTPRAERRRSRLSVVTLKLMHSNHRA